MSNYHPYQLIRRVSLPGNLGQSRFLLAACASTLYSVAVDEGLAATSGEILGTWPHVGENAKVDIDDEPQTKKRKVDRNGVDNGRDIILLEVAPDQQHIVLVTNGDKCITVLRIADDGSFTELSQRCMPKRPSALQITHDSSSIVCGDKFGDVYLLPLIPGSEGRRSVTVEPSNGHKPADTYKPAASEMTVHTQRNRRALEEQQRQKGKTKKSKEPLAFEHQLVLGHVAMLTDLQLASRDDKGLRRDFVITSDRDEHIRVSRGPPQAYVIQSFCLGHKEFVSRIQLVPGTELLISAGGDDWLGVWHWPSGRLMAKKDLSCIRKGRPGLGDHSQRKIAVQKLWICETSSSGYVLVVKCDGLATLLALDLSNVEDESVQAEVLEMDYSATTIDLEQVTAGVLAVSADDSQRLRAVLLGKDDGRWKLQAKDSMDNLFARLNELKTARPSPEVLDTLFGDAEKLRKRDIEDDQTVEQ